MASASSSVAARSMPAKQSVPARAFSANWYGRVARSNIGANCRASVRETRRRNVSPVAMPRTPPAGLESAVRREGAFLLVSTRRRVSRRSITLRRVAWPRKRRSRGGGDPRGRRRGQCEGTRRGGPRRHRHPRRIRGRMRHTCAEQQARATAAAAAVL